MDRATLVAALAVPAVLCGLWTIVAGKDVNWDLLNYHYYLPYEFLGGRLSQDFFAASAQSYLNPLGYVPFFLMVSAGWHSVAVSVLLAIVHGSSLTLLFLLARMLFADLPVRQQTVFAALGTALGAATWVFWPTVGSSFLDPLLVPLVLAGVFLTLRDSPGRLALAGALLGAAAALKYSNAVYLLAALPVALGAPGDRSRVRRGAAFLGGGALAIAVLAGPWLMELAREFGNPVFPLMNGWFRSPYAAPVNLVGERFSPQAWVDVLALPFRMATLNRHLYAETFAPDVRVAALVLAALALPVTRARVALAERVLKRTDWQLLAFFAVAWVLWALSSANGRYGMALLLMAGLLLARLLERMLPSGAARIVLGVLLAVQVAVSLIAAPTRWYNAEPWSTRWLPYDVPQRALSEPALYLSVEVQPMAVVVPFVNPASSFVNFRGQHSLASDAPRLMALLERHRNHVRAIGQRLQLAGGAPTPAAIEAYDSAFRQLGLRLDSTDCFTVAWRPDEDALARAANRVAFTLPSAEPLSVGTCALRPAPREPSDVEAERRISAVFAQIERSCALLRGQTAVTETFGRGWLRHYNGLDARLEVLGDRVVLHRFGRGEIIELGTVADWARDEAAIPAACRAPV